MSQIKNWKKTHDHKKSVRWKHRNVKAKMGVTGLANSRDHVPFRRADKAYVSGYATPPDGFLNDIVLVKKEFDTKKEALDFARNWMRNNPDISGAEERSEQGKEIVRQTSVTR